MKESIVIVPVANGFQVQPDVPVGQVTLHEIYVFQTLDALFEHMKGIYSDDAAERPEQ